MTPDNIPLVNPQAERFVIGAVVLSNGRILRKLLETGIGPEDFASNDTRYLWDAIQQYREQMNNSVLAAETLQAWIGAKFPHKLDVAGKAILDCIHEVTIPEHALGIASDLMLLTARRRTAKASARLRQIAETTPADNADEMYDLLVSQARAEVRERRQAQKLVFCDIATERYTEWDAPVADILPTAWMDLDYYLDGGLRPGDLCIVGARPAVGKSMFATELARTAAAAQRPTYFASLEMSTKVVTDRIAAASTGVPLTTLLSQRCNEEQMIRCAAFLKRSADWPLFIDDTCNVRLVNLSSRANGIAEDSGGLDLIIVDYLQLMTPADASTNREQQVGSISRGLKLLGKETRAAVVALAQVSRGAAGTRPALHHLRESGSIEADADVVLLLHRDDPDNDAERTTDLEVEVAKNRHGDTGIVHLAWQPRVGRIGSLLRST